MVELLFKLNKLKGCVLLVCLLMAGMASAQVTPIGGVCDDGDCSDTFTWSSAEDGSGTKIENFGEGVASSTSCSTSIEASVDYEGTDTNLDVTGLSISANNQDDNWTDSWTFSFSEVLTNPEMEFVSIESSTTVTLTDCGGAAIPLVGNPSGTFMGSADVQLNGDYDCVVVTVSDPGGDDAYRIRVSTCLSNVPTPPCINCEMGDEFEYLTLTNKMGSLTGATADVELDGVLYGSATVLYSDLDVSEDLRGSTFGAFDNDGGVFVLQIDLCEPITIQQVDILGLENESQAWVGTELTGSGIDGIPSGLTLAQCGGGASMAPTGSMVTNMAGSCSNQGNGNYTVGGASVSTLYFRYTNPAGGCSFDKATFRIASCVADESDVVPLCPLTIVDITEDVDPIDDMPSITTYIRDANGVYFASNLDCEDVFDATAEGGGMSALAVAKISPCAEVVDEKECSLCEPTPPCTTCADGNTYEYIDLRNYDSGTGVGDIYLNGVLIGSSEVLPANNTLSISEDLSGKRFGAFANGNAMDEMLIMKLEFCEPLAIQQIDILGLEGESQVWVGTAIAGTDVTGGTIDECGSATDAGMVVDGTSNTVINQAGCGNQGDGNYTFSESSVSVLYFKYENVAGGCKYDKTTYRIGVCAPELVQSTPMCSLEVLESSVTLADGSVETELVVKGEDGKYYEYTDLPNMGKAADLVDLDEVAVSPCATLTPVCGATDEETKDTRKVCKVCFIEPVFGDISCSTESPVITKPFTITATGLENMKGVDNNETDFNLNAYLYPAGTTAADFAYPPATTLTIEEAAAMTSQPTVPVFLGVLALTNDCTEGSLTVQLPSDFPQGAYNKVFTLDKAPTLDPDSEPSFMLPEVEVIPTMGQWALFILALMFSVLAVVRIRESKNHEVKELA